MMNNKTTFAILFVKSRYLTKAEGTLFQYFINHSANFLEVRNSITPCFQKTRQEIYLFPSPFINLPNPPIHYQLSAHFILTRSTSQNMRGARNFL